MNAQELVRAVPEVVIAEQIVAALELKPAGHAAGSERLSLGSLLPEPAKRSTNHIVGRVDRSGRISARTLLTSLSWRPADRIAIRACRDCVVLARSSAGVERLRSTRFVTIPVRARTMAGIGVGETVLISALPRQELIIVHSHRALETMVLEYLGRPGQL
ncbi:hypothetical protein ACWEVP_03055 [Amycolatopsis sp. NPDC003865]